MSIFRLAIIISLLALNACSRRGFVRDELRSSLPVQRVVTDEEIKRALELKPQLPQRFKLAVYQLHDISRYYGDRSAPWSSGDSAAIEQGVCTPLKEKLVISDCLFLNSFLTEGKDLKSIRLAAARAGADGVLILTQKSDVDRWNNVLGITYIALLPGWFVPGTTAEALAVTHAALIDVANEFVYLSLETDAIVRRTRPAFLLDNKPLILEAREKALRELTSKIVEMLVNAEIRSPGWSRH